MTRAAIVADANTRDRIHVDAIAAHPIQEHTS